MFEINGKEYECTIAVTLDVFNDKWKLFIIWNLLDEEKRFKDLGELMPQITTKTLSVKLKELEGKNIIHREVFPEVPPKVVYSLTSTGEKLRPLFREMIKWGMDYVNDHGKTTGEHVGCEANVAKKIGAKK